MPSNDGPGYRPPPPTAGSPARTLPNSRNGPVVPESAPPSASTLQKASASKAFLENHYRSMIKGLRRMDPPPPPTPVANPNSSASFGAGISPPLSPSANPVVVAPSPSPSRIEQSTRESSPIYRDPLDNTQKSGEEGVVFVGGGFGGVAVDSCSETDSHEAEAVDAPCTISPQRPSGRGSSPPIGRPSLSVNDDASLGRRPSRQMKSFVKINSHLSPAEEAQRAATGRTSSILSDNTTAMSAFSATQPASLAATVVGPRIRDIRPTDFNLLKIVGRGAFGEVYICTRKQHVAHSTTASLANTVNFMGDSATSMSNTISNPGSPHERLYAMKRMRKIDMLKKKQVFHVRSERNVLAEAAADNPWIVQLHYSFQDEQYLYMVTDYLPGGDLMSWLISEQIFSVAQTRFYIAELCAAIHSVHDMNYVHRDIKPDNILVDDQGHIRLSDFGLCKKFSLPSKQARQKWLERHERRALKNAHRMVKKMKEAAAEEERKEREEPSLDPTASREKRNSAREFREAADLLQQQLNAERLPAGYEPPTSSPVNVDDDASSHSSDESCGPPSQEDTDFFAPTPNDRQKKAPSTAGSTVQGVSASPSGASSHQQGRGGEDDDEVDLYEEDELLPTTVWRPNLEDTTMLGNTMSVRQPYHHRSEHLPHPSAAADSPSFRSAVSPHHPDESPGKNPWVSESERQHDLARATMKDAIRRRQKFQSIVGSPGYIAPEILLRQQYGVNCDYWSVGVIMYEMLFGYPPFYSENPQSTCDKIVRWRHFLRFPREQHPHVPKEAIDLIRHLLCDAPDRFEFEQIKEHPFFACVDWDTLRHTMPPSPPDMLQAFAPELSHATDTRYFPELEEITNLYGGQQAPSDSLSKVLQEEDPRGVMFADFKYRRD